MPAETGDEALEAELRTEALLDEVDVHTAAAYEAGVWRELRRGGGKAATGGGPSRRAQERTWMGMVRILWVCRSGGKACLELEVTCRRRWLRLRKRMVSG